VNTNVAQGKGSQCLPFRNVSTNMNRASIRLCAMIFVWKIPVEVANKQSEGSGCVVRRGQTGSDKI